MRGLRCERCHIRFLAPETPASGLPLCTRCTAPVARRLTSGEVDRLLAAVDRASGEREAFPAVDPGDAPGQLIAFPLRRVAGER